MNFLRELMFECLPHCEEKLAYNVPFYYYHSRICFIWPASVPWGKVKISGVKVGFCRGNLLQDNASFLDREGRKQVASKTYFNIEEVEIDLLRSFLIEAYEIDKVMHQNA